MASTLRNTPKSYRPCIFYTFQLGRSIEEAYKHFRKNTEYDNFYYVEYWLDRFATGNINLKNESFDKEPKSFSNLPIEILGTIVRKLDTKSRFSTRKVSRFLRNFVDNQPQYDKMDIDFHDDDISIKYETHRVSYNKHAERCRIGEKVLNGDFVDIALNDLAIALKNPKLQLKLLQMTCSRNAANTYKKKVLDFFKSLKSPIHVKSVNFLFPDVQFALLLLSLLKPGTLEGIRLDYINPEMFTNQLIKMDQWKQAKRFFTNTPMSVDIKKFLHFNQFEITLLSESISAQFVIFLRDTFSNCTNSEICYLSISGSDISISVIKQIGKALGAEVVVPRTAHEVIIFHRHPIPGSNQFLEFSIYHRELSIRRTD